MTKIKRLTSTLIVMIIFISSINFVTADMAAQLSIKASKSSDNKKITVRIACNSEADIESMKLTLEYPKDLIIPVSVTNLATNKVTSSSSYANNDGKVAITVNAKDETIGNGNFFDVVFEIKKEIKQKTTISFSLSASDIINIDQERISSNIGKDSITLDPPKEDPPTEKPTDPPTETPGEQPQTKPTITLDQNQATLIESEFINLKATITPETLQNKKVTYKSSHPAIASVDQNGKVTALKAGKATITATLAEGGAKANCVITVTPKVKITSIILQNTEAKIKINQKYNLMAAVLPDGATNKDLVYSSSNNAVAMVDQNGLVTAKKEGLATITVKTKDNALSKHCIITVIDQELSQEQNITILGTLYDSKNKPIKNRRIELMPNDIRANVNENGSFTLYSVENKDYTLYLYNKNGTQVEAKGTLIVSALNNYEIDVVLNGSNLIISETIIKQDETPVDIETASFTVKEIRIKEKEEYQLLYTISPKEATAQIVKFVIKDSNVASVQQNGMIIAKTKGYTTIKITTQDGKVLDECTIQVDGLDSNKKSHLIIIGEAAILVGIFIWFALAYNRYKKSQERKENRQKNIKFKT